MQDLDRRAARRFLETLWADEEAVVEAVVSDGWPEGMVRAGLALHRQTWDVETLVRSIEMELAGVLESPDHSLRWPASVHHIWPALPGAGVTPCLVGILLGIPQRVRPSRRGLGFARRLAECCEVDLIEPDDDWTDTDLVVVSGSDETVAAVREKMAGRGRVIGYGHRVSLALVVDDPEKLELDTVAARIAGDIVMWHQRGCFSVRAVHFCGSAGRRQRFCQKLARAIAEREREWGADKVGESELAARAQALGVAQMKGEVWQKGLGYVRCEAGPFTGGQEAVHAVTVHPVDGPESLAAMIDVPHTQIQGVAIAGAWRDSRQRWLDALSEVGATRIAPAGTMQAPPANWWHDGRPNALSWATVVTR